MSFCPSGFIVELFFIQNGLDERSVPGTTIAVQADMPFNGLTTFGTAFLSKFECSRMPHPVNYKFEFSTFTKMRTKFLNIFL